MDAGTSGPWQGSPAVWLELQCTWVFPSVVLSTITRGTAVHGTHLALH